MLNVMAPLKPMQKSQTNVTIAKDCKNYIKLQRGLHKNCKTKKCENVIALEKLVVGGDEDLKENEILKLKINEKNKNYIILQILVPIKALKDSLYQRNSRYHIGGTREALLKGKAQYT